MRSLSQSSTSDSNHPTREGPSCTRLGNLPAASSRAICAGEYRTFSRTCLFDNIRITMLPVGRRCNASVSQGATSITLPESLEVGSPLLPRFLSLGQVFGAVVHGHNALHPVMEHLFDYVGCYAQVGEACRHCSSEVVRGVPHAGTFECSGERAVVALFSMTGKVTSEGDEVYLVVAEFRFRPMFRKSPPIF